MNIPATRPYFSDEDIEFINSRFEKIMKGESYLSMYKYGSRFEEAFSSYIGTEHAVACNSGTSALELIFRGLSIEGKEVILPSNTFLATAIAIINAGGKPVFAECNADMCIDYEDVNKKINGETAAVTTVHIGGLVSKDILKLRELCDANSIYLVEDAAQAHGSSFNEIRAGSFGIAAGFSFFSTKVMTTGEGGMVTTNNVELCEKMRSMREFGKVRKGIATNYHRYFGYNWRMPEVSALMGLCQLKSLPKFIERRQEIASIYNKELENKSSIRIIEPEQFKSHNFFKYIVELIDKEQEEIHHKMIKNGISPSGYVYEIPLHKQPVFSGYKDKLEVTERLCRKHFCLPIFYGLSDEEAKYVAKTFSKILDS